MTKEEASDIKDEGEQKQARKKMKSQRRNHPRILHLPQLWSVALQMPRQQQRRNNYHSHSTTGSTQEGVGITRERQISTPFVRSCQKRKR
jgi:hypothetical protein